MPTRTTKRTTTRRPAGRGSRKDIDIKAKWAEKHLGYNKKSARQWAKDHLGY